MSGMLATTEERSAQVTGLPTSSVAEAARNAALEAQVEDLKALVEELRRSRDQWRDQAARLALAAAAAEMAAPASGRRWWWRRSA